MRDEQCTSSDGGARRRMMPLLLPVGMAAAIFGSLNLGWATARRSQELDGASQLQSLQPPSALAAELTDDAELSVMDAATPALAGGYDTGFGRAAPDEEVVALLDLMTDNKFGNVQCTDVSYALCDVSTCTLASDVGVAMCGCISKRASASDTASLAVGWSSGLLARADPYVQWLRDLNTTWHNAAQGTGDDDALATVEAGICPYLRDARLWGAIGAKRISLFGSDSPQVDDATETVEACADTVGANCQGAPCFDVAYDGVFNVTCLCQRTERDTQYVTRSTTSDGASSFSCSDINSTHCGVVSSTAYPEEWGVVSRQIEVITENYASLLVDSDPGKCPATA